MGYEKSNLSLLATTEYCKPTPPAMVSSSIESTVESRRMHHQSTSAKPPVQTVLCVYRAAPRSLFIINPCVVRRTDRLWNYILLLPVDKTQQVIYFFHYLFFYRLGARMFCLIQLPPSLLYLHLEIYIFFLPLALCTPRAREIQFLTISETFISCNLFFFSITF